MFIIYKKGEILNQVVSWGADRERTLQGSLFLVTVAQSLIDLIFGRVGNSFFCDWS
jgi:hypothetical protein